MVRTQIYLTQQERVGLTELSKSTGKSSSEIIREAIDYFLGNRNSSSKKMILKRMAGIWKNRKDIPDFDSIRKDWDRDFKA